MDLSYVLMIGFGWVVLSVPAAMVLGRFMGAHGNESGDFETIPAAVSLPIDLAA
jgi:hypothetical protein